MWVKIVKSFYKLQSQTLCPALEVVREGRSKIKHKTNLFEITSSCLKLQNKQFRIYKDNAATATDYAARKDRGALHHLCVNQVGFKLLSISFLLLCLE